MCNMSWKYHCIIAIGAILDVSEQQYLGVSAVLLGVGGETLDRVSFRVAERTLDNGDAVRMDHPAVPSQIWWTKQQVLLIHSFIYFQRAPSKLCLTCLSWGSREPWSSTSCWFRCRRQQAGLQLGGEETGRAQQPGGGDQRADGGSGWISGAANLQHPWWCEPSCCRRSSTASGRRGRWRRAAVARPAGWGSAGGPSWWTPERPRGTCISKHCSYLTRSTVMNASLWKPADSTNAFLGMLSRNSGQTCPDRPIVNY